MLRKIAFIGTGGTIASIGSDQFDLLDYNASDQRIDAKSLIERIGIDGIVADLVPIDFRRIDSTAITMDDWADLADLCHDVARDETVDGIVIGHGTASLEETAWALSLVLDLHIPVVITGSMRPLTGISSDANANLAAAIRVAASGRSDIGVVVVVNDEIHSPRRVTKGHTLRLNAFQSPWHGPIGYVDGPHVRMGEYCQRLRGGFDRQALRSLPRVDISYSYVGCDGVAIAAFVAAGAKGIVSAGFGPGMGTPSEIELLADAVKRGVVVIQSARTGAGLVVDGKHHQSLGIIAGNDLSPQKARILLALCLARGDTSSEIAGLFHSL
ncbi:asparaginase [Rhizobium metallidurans]|uniref:L-asparaginase n=1 Tax=Rhizobium metallidurans TaxID=1265931 RepID=A0A7W6CX39_9HYPH|nr:asparaginase [Rhizobium metallidurans]MBB3966094.1 L-asparaginase [Rhizobium metallidurans]